MSDLRIDIDFGGTKIEAAALDGNGEFATRLRAANPGNCSVVDPDTIILGGGMSNARILYERLPGAVRPYIFSDNWRARIVPARWGDSSGVRGAARLWSS
jgi:fructokinase